MARTPNPRRVILHDLRLILRWMRWAVGQFDHGRRIYDTELRRIRERTDAEMVENDPAKLREAAKGARRAADVLLQIAEFAETTAAEIEAR